LAPSPAPPRLVHVMPPPGVVPVVTGEGVDFAVEADAGGAVAYTWELDGTRVGSGPRYRFQTDFLARVGEHTLALKASDPVSGASVGEHWVLTLDGRNSEPEVTIARPGHDVAAGQALVLQATVRDPDTPRGDKVGCAWTVNGAAATGDCQRLNWKVPAGVPTGQIVAALTVKDLRGAAVTRTISVPVRGLGPPPVAVARAATPTRPVPAPPRAAATVSPATGAGATSAPVPPAPVPPARAPAAVAAHADDDEVQVRAAIDGEARRYESLVRGRGGRVTDYKVLAITRDGNRAEVKITRTVELPAQRPQVAEKELIVRKHDGVWSVGE